METIKALQIRLNFQKIVEIVEVAQQEQTEQEAKQEVQLEAQQEMLAVLGPQSAARGIPSMVVTMGAQGSVYVDNRTDERGICPAGKVDVVDTTGAGDAFFSAAVVALTRGKPLSEAVRLGTALASRTLRVQGSCAVED